MFENESDEKMNGIPIKTLIIGDTSVGKTNIMTRFAKNEFSENTLATIGMNFGSKKITLENNKTICFQIWDTSGQEKFFCTPNSFFSGAHGCFIVYDITNQESFDHLDIWFNKIKEVCSRDLSIILVGNKCDLKDQRKIDENSGIKKAKNFECPFFETSAKDNKNIEEIYKKMGQNIYEKMGDKIIIKNLPRITYIESLKYGNNRKEELKRGKDINKKNSYFCY